MIPQSEGPTGDTYGHYMGHHSAPMGHHFDVMGHQMGHHLARSDTKWDTILHRWDTKWDTNGDRQRRLRVLVSVHGSDGSAEKYMDIPVSKGDDDRYDLIIVAPQFPTSKNAPNSDMNGLKFDSYHSSSHRWLHTLLHCHLPGILLDRELVVDTRKVYLFGHSRGGQFVHTYMLKHHSEDVLRAAICGAGLLRRGDHEDFRNMGRLGYEKRLSALVRANVAFIVGTSDCKCGDRDGGLVATPGGNAWEDNFCPNGVDKWDRQKEVMNYFNIELVRKLGRQYMRCIISQPPDWHPDGAHFPIDRVTPVRPQWVKNVRFFWKPNLPDTSGNPVQGHRGWRNYERARMYLFEPNSVCCPLSFLETMLSRFGFLRRK